MPAHRDEIEDVGADHGAIRHALAYHCSPQPHVVCVYACTRANRFGRREDWM
jgi:hypothetical protein